MHSEQMSTSRCDMKKKSQVKRRRVAQKRVSACKYVVARVCRVVRQAPLRVGEVSPASRATSVPRTRAGKRGMRSMRNQVCRASVGAEAGASAARGGARVGAVARSGAVAGTASRREAATRAAAVCKVTIADDSDDSCDEYINLLTDCDEDEWRLSVARERAWKRARRLAALDAAERAWLNSHSDDDDAENDA